MLVNVGFLNPALVIPNELRRREDCAVTEAFLAMNPTPGLNILNI